MLAEIAANPTSLPLWAVFLFAAAMYPLGLLLPGCPCCGTSGCTQCGTFAAGYASGQNEYGRMCCTGTVASSVTVRLTNVGTATSTYVVRGTTTPSYSRTTSTFSCSAIAGDYVLSLQRINAGSYANCSWAGSDFSSCAAYREASVAPLPYDPNNTATTVSFPTYYLSLSTFIRTMNGSVRLQTCSGYPGVESCNIGTTVSSSVWNVWQTDRPFVILSDQRCNPAGTLLASAQAFSTDTQCGSGTTYGPYDTGCRYQVELV